jgi:hypothetical protein
LGTSFAQKQIKQLTVYFISGQAADEKLFENLILPPGFNPKYIRWIEPFEKETLVSYSKRIAQQVNTLENFVLIGVSLGGIVSVELNKFLKPRLTIIISSIATAPERPPYFRLINLLKLHKIAPGGLYKWYNPFVNWYFGVRNKREKELIRLYMRSATIRYMKWSTGQVLNWKNKERPANLFHIHGTADRIFLHRFTRADIKIENGTHLMVHNKAEEISKIIAEKLNSITI